MTKDIQSYAIEDISWWHPNVECEHVVSCAVALMMEHGESACCFAVECRGWKNEGLDMPDVVRFKVTWRQETVERVRRTLTMFHRHHLIEHGAIAIACIAIAKIFDLRPLEVMQIGDGADYWLKNKQEMLEVSGTERAGELERRHREKTEQLLEGLTRHRGYVFVCCFASRRAIFSIHRPGGDKNGKDQKLS